MTGCVDIVSKFNAAAFIDARTATKHNTDLRNSVLITGVQRKLIL